MEMDVRLVLARDSLRLARVGCGVGRSRRGSGGRPSRGRWRLLLRTLLELRLGAIGSRNFDLQCVVVVPTIVLRQGR